MDKDSTMAAGANAGLGDLSGFGGFGPDQSGAAASPDAPPWGAPGATNWGGDVSATPAITPFSTSGDQSFVNPDGSTRQPDFTAGRDPPPSWGADLNQPVAPGNPSQVAPIPTHASQLAPALAPGQTITPVGSAPQQWEPMGSPSSSDSWKTSTQKPNWWDAMSEKTRTGIAKGLGEAGKSFQAAEQKRVAQMQQGDAKDTKIQMPSLISGGGFGAFTPFKS